MDALAAFGAAFKDGDVVERFPKADPHDPDNFGEPEFM